MTDLEITLAAKAAVNNQLLATVLAIATRHLGEEQAPYLSSLFDTALENIDVSMTEVVNATGDGARVRNRLFVEACEHAALVRKMTMGIAAVIRSGSSDGNG